MFHSLSAFYEGFCSSELLGISAYTSYLIWNITVENRPLLGIGRTAWLGA
jgi:hypothetical protein